MMEVKTTVGNVLILVSKVLFYNVWCHLERIFVETTWTLTKHSHVGGISLNLSENKYIDKCWIFVHFLIFFFILERNFTYVM